MSRQTPMRRAAGGFWALPHELHREILCQNITGEQLRVWLALGALTQGFGAERDRVSAGQIAEFCGLSRRNVYRALAALEGRGLVGKRRISDGETERWVLAPAAGEGGVNDSGADDTGGGVMHGGSGDTHQYTKKEDTNTTPPAGGVPAELCGLALYEADGKLCRAWGELLGAWKVAFPRLDVLAEVRKAHAWESANPARRKTDRRRFLNTWLGNAERVNKARGDEHGKTRSRAVRERIDDGGTDYGNIGRRITLPA
jgi:phage replication O-like protein O